MADCNPCQYCMNLYDDSDESVGLYGYGCMAQDDGKETFDDGLRPCSCFKPAGLSSDGLMDQLYYEEEARFYQDQERFFKEQDRYSQYESRLYQHSMQV